MVPPAAVSPAPLSTGPRACGEPGARHAEQWHAAAMTSAPGPRRLVLRPGTPILTRSPGVVQVGLDEPVVRAADAPGVRDLLTALARPRGLPEETDAEPALLERLRAAGLLVVVPDGEVGSADQVLRAQAGPDAVRRQAARAGATIAVDAPPALEELLGPLLDQAGLRRAGTAAVHLVVSAGPLDRESAGPVGARRGPAPGRQRCRHRPSGRALRRAWTDRVPALRGRARGRGRRTPAAAARPGRTGCPDPAAAVGPGPRHLRARLGGARPVPLPGGRHAEHLVGDLRPRAARRSGRDLLGTPSRLRLRMGPDSACCRERARSPPLAVEPWPPSPGGGPGSTRRSSGAPGRARLRTSRSAAACHRRRAGHRSHRRRACPQGRSPDGSRAAS
ncbi:hypothetical protein G5V59_08345 [Nocardioides sp. W3-2-3]|uniref:hypothetical protein n=1 Tax=Nocardioides convexus TaxID=2712224 RepID=UPI0024187205|nr:hypothetical protein [Nocardioides convexus]NHA00151.1 hypothetical protein [Nocardioides convexus]